jgi:hypothetical protein
MKGDYVLDSGALGMLAEDNSGMLALVADIDDQEGRTYVPAVVLAECLGDARHDPSYYRAFKGIGGLDECVIAVGTSVARRAGAILKQSGSKETIDGIVVAAAESLGTETVLVTGDRPHMMRLAASAAVRLSVVELRTLGNRAVKLRHQP